MRRASGDKPFDVTTKQLVEIHPADWLAYVGLPLAPVEIVNADLATVTAGADKVLRVGARRPYLGNIEFQSGYEANLDERTATYLLMGLRYPRELAVQLLRGVRAMKESVTYQAIIEEGQTTEVQRILLRQGTKRFGPCPSAVQAAIEGMTSVERLEQLAERLLDVESWEDLLAG